MPLNHWKQFVTTLCPVWTAASRCSIPIHSLLWTTFLNGPNYQPVVWQQATGIKAAAGCSSPEKVYLQRLRLARTSAIWCATASATLGTTALPN
jgi:hypothetical protein